MVVGEGGPIEDEGRRVVDQERWGDVVAAEIEESITSLTYE